MPWIYILIVILILGIIIYFSLRAHNKMVAEGKIISRRTDFMESAEVFTLTATDPARVTEAVKALNYADMRVHMQGSSEQQIFRFSGNSWNAKLQKMSGDDAQMVYRFEFTNWKTHNGMPQDALSMNKLTTAVEKLFVALDANTRVQTVPLEFKTKHSFF